MHLPFLFRNIPALLNPTIAPATKAELDQALTVRRAFNLPGWPDPYMNDIVRAFRIARGAKTYVEIGSRDKGNVAWLVKNVLADDAVIVDLDIEAFPAQEQKLKNYLKPRQRYHSVTGDSVGPAIIEKISGLIGKRGADVIFCDTAHTFQHTLTEFDAYFPLLAPSGVVIFHDCYFENSGAAVKGKSLALQQLDRMIPVYAVFADEPTHRHLPREQNTPVWGGCGMICRQD